MEGYQALANAIILKAVEDWREAQRKIKQKEGSSRDSDKITVSFAKAKKAEVEKFFRSEWFSILTPLDGEKLIRMLEENPTVSNDAQFIMGVTT